MTSVAVNTEPSTPPTAVAQMRILVVDDEDTIRLVLAKYLRTRGFDVATAESGDAALETLAKKKELKRARPMGCSANPTTPNPKPSPARTTFAPASSATTSSPKSPPPSAAPTSVSGSATRT